MLALALALALGMGLQAQERYTLTDGTLQWHRYTKAGHTSVGVDDVRVYGDRITGIPSDGGSTDTLIDLAQGDRYLMLDLSDSDNPKVKTQAKNEGEGFSPYCVWLRTGRTGYYYQDWDGYRYYLRGNNSGLWVDKLAVSEAITNSTYWYDWDFGAAMQETSFIEGVMRNAYYWVMLRGNEWVMSCDSYERPETRIYTNPNSTPVAWSEALLHYSCEEVVDGNLQPTGHGALFMPVTRIEHPAEVDTASGVGLTGLAATMDGSSVETLQYGNEVVLGPQYTPGHATVTDAYIEYVEEKSRKSIAFRWYNRTGTGAGTPDLTNYYYKVDDKIRLTGKPVGALQTLNLVRVEYRIDNASQRYLSVEKNLSDPDSSATLRYNSYSHVDREAEVEVIYTYSYGSTGNVRYISQSRKLKLKLSSKLSDETLPQPANAPVVRGAVFGGGRMANVAKTTRVSIYNCDTISAVYGGNDISGQVQGAKGSTVRIGVDNDSTTLAVRIGSVYGGGNGYYTYPDIIALPATNSRTLKGEVRDYGTGSVAVATVSTDAYYPDIQATRVVVNSDRAVVDTLFGGSRNAYVDGTGTGTADTLVRVEFVKGTAFAVFGGNNVGGSIADRTPVSVVVKGTKLNGENDTSTLNTWFTGFGRQFGIRYLFGGGNMVATPKVMVKMAGGMVDTLFGGGNQASVTGQVEVKAEVADANVIYHNKTIDNPDKWLGGRGRYNVRTLFGGNNRANMEIVPHVTLASGGIGTVYGGGNAGDMLASAAPDATLKVDFAESDAHFKHPTKLGTYVSIPSTSRIKIDYLFGGCQLADVRNSTYVVIEGGEVGTVYGGCNVAGDVGSRDFTTDYNGAYVVMKGGTVHNSVFGGAAGNYHCTGVVGSATEGIYVDGLQFGHNDGVPFDPYDAYLGYPAPTLNATYLYLNGGEVKGYVYGGGMMANVGHNEATYKHYDFASSSVESQKATMRLGEVHMTLDGVRVSRNVYGGGNSASVYGLAYLDVKGTTAIAGSLFAGNDKNGSVEAFGAYEDRVSGLKEGDFKASDGTALNIESGSWTRNYTSYVKLEGTPTITCVYGGGNGAYNYNGTAEEQALYGDQLQLCRVAKPIQTSSFVDIHVEGGTIDTVFGGGNGVGVTEGVLVLLNATETSEKYVHTIFGGNNRDNMEIVPDIRLLAGKVGTVYGGCNAGNMSGQGSYTNRCGTEQVENVATYILVDNADVTVDTAIFGGCKQASVVGTTYIDIRNTSDYGVNYVYGGSDMSGEVENTRIDVSGGRVKHIYGGSNGYYDYVEMGDGDNTVYEYNHTTGATPLAYHTLGEPTVGSTLVNIYGGIFESSVYGGGRMGVCENTHVVVNDQPGGSCAGLEATIYGTVYGGGQGDYEHLNKTHRGNVTYLSQVDLYHATEVSSAKAYGGGQGGDVYNTLITSHDTWDKPLNELYGGCWGSDVLGTATVDMNGKHNVGSLFGGNDQTGNVYRSVVNVGSGTFGNIYGAGNGNYEGIYGTDKLLPNNEYVEVNINSNGLDEVQVYGNVYGGGLLGTVWRTVKDANGEDVRDANLLRTPDTSTTYTSAEDYAHVIVNMHGGTVAGNVYAGGAGNENPIIYGLKMLNMDGGQALAVYGGSENVSDGYMHEYKEPGATDSTTMRPSSILNLVGGTVQTNVYGGGYLGNVYGSVYVNIGLAAVLNSPVWTNKYGAGPDCTGRATDSTYKKFMPGYKEGYVADLKADVGWPLQIENSVYGGANWGENSGSALFNMRGFYGGEGRILVDGKGYNTKGDAISTEPLMNIGNSIIGSGTSALGGDVLCRIDVQNYGAVGTDCHATKKLNAIQRADELWLRNTAIHYLGSSDASSIYTSQMYTVNRIEDVNVRGYNVMELDAVMTNIYTLNYYEDALDSDSNLVLTKDADLYVVDHDQCDDAVTTCKQLSVIDPVTNKRSALLVNNGVNVDIYYPDKYTGYGEVNGFAYLMAENGTSAVVMARPKYHETNKLDGGFMSTCSEKNKKRVHMASHADSTRLDWVNGIHPQDTLEFPYYNFNDSYRVWKMGEGKRVRYAVILAHATPKTLYTFDRTIRTTRDNYSSGDDSVYLSLAHAELELPPSTPGHYYKLSSTNGIVFSNDNTNPMNLVDSVWNPNWGSTSDSVWAVNAPGNWKTPEMEDGQEGKMMGLNDLYNDPANSYGLLLASGANFASGTDAVPFGHTEADGTWGSTPLTGNSYATFLANFASAKVSSSAYTTPIMDLFLTYNNQFATTTISTVKFTLEEWVDNTNLNSDIDVVVTISTIIDNFRDVEYDVLAMYNEGRTNTFERKVILPATLQHRELYLDSVQWFPVSADGKDTLDEAATVFYLTGDKSNVTTSADNNRFCLGIQPVDNISSTATSSIGWHTVNSTTPTDIYSSVKSPETGLDKVSDGTLPSGMERLRPLPTLLDSKGRGLKLGELDGRGLAAIKLLLTFNGNNIYPKDSYVGRVILTMSSYVGGDDEGSRFHITVNVYCREHGDTIYLATKGSIPNPSGSDYTPCIDLSTDGVGKTPSKYLQTFTDALRTGIYREGDVICLLDEVKIDKGDLTIQGADYMPITVMRYDGHHHELPGDDYVYRGTMVSVQGTSEKPASFTTRNIYFDGTMLSKVQVAGTHSAVQQPLYLKDELINLSSVTGTDIPLYSDTNRVYGPIISVGGFGTVSLGEGTTVCNNWNASDNTPGNTSKLGAINVSDGGTLALGNTVTIEHNISQSTATDACTVINPTNGAVYVNNGTVELLESNSSTKVTITDNYLMDIGDVKEFWKDQLNSDEKLVRYAYNDGVLDIPANVLLTRTEAAPHDVMSDAITDQIVFNNALPAGTRIGVSKWFPGEDVRDTICIALQPSSNYINSAYLNQNFQSDCENYDVFYNYGVNNQHLYLHRCATFRFQQTTGDDLAGGWQQRQPVRYIADEQLGCPTGGDTVVASVKGGFFPYQYTWTGATPRTHNTGVANNVVNQRMKQAEPDYTYYHAALADTLITSNLGMSFEESEKHWIDTLTVTDLAGCRQMKKMDVTVKKVDEVNAVFKEVTEPTNHWTSPDTAVVAEGVREFLGIRITPMAWVDRTKGTISAVVGGPDKDYVYQGGEGEEPHVLSSLYFCQGDVIKLAARPKETGDKFIMWDFDPYYEQPATYVVPAVSDTVTAYFGPGNYWVDVVKNVDVAHAVYDETFDYDTCPEYSSGIPASYVTTYHGDVHIYDEQGLAWFISVVNGLNGTQARPFYFNRVFLHKKSDNSPYDMRDHLWTPVGTRQHPFRGWFLGVGEGAADTAVLATGEQVTIKNIIVNEPNANYTGLFGFLDAATVRSIKIEGALVRGSQYVGAVAASSKNTKIWNCQVTDKEEGESKPTTILSTHYASGGVVGLSEEDTIQVTGSAVKYIGDAVYSGGIVGYGTSSKIRNSWTRNYNRMEGVYIGGMAGYMDGKAPYRPSLLRAKSAGNPSVVENNYVYLATSGGSDRVGGLVGYAENTVMRNNYVYGDVRGRMTDGAVSGSEGDNVSTDENYYASAALGHADEAATAFSGQGNQVLTDEPVRGLDNLTRLLNRWVREQGEGYLTWRSDLEGSNGGYPVFGQPDMIPVRDSLLLSGCGEVEYGGVVYDTTQTVVLHVVDSTLMVDSTLTLRVEVAHGGRLHLADSAIAGVDYEGYGFRVSAAESQLLRATIDSLGSATLVLYDTIAVEDACDSVVSLRLTFTAPSTGVQPIVRQPEARVYPNPTTSVVHVECEGLQHVELYDAEGRRLDDYVGAEGGRIAVDVQHLPGGSYYLRIHAEGMAPVIQKVIKK